MKLLPALCFAFVCLITASHGKVVAGSYDMPAVRDASTLETRVIEDWHPWAKDAGVRQKLIEITVCEWWPGQKVRLPVTLLAPAKGYRTGKVLAHGVGPDATVPDYTLLQADLTAADSNSRSN